MGPLASFKKFLHYFLHDVHLKYKFMIINLILVLVPTIFVFTFLFGRLSSIVTTNTIESEQALVSQTASTLEATISQVNYACDSITSTPFLSQATYTADINGFLLDPANAIAARDFFSNINSLIDHKFITAVKIYIPEFRDDLTDFYSFSDIIEPSASIEGNYWSGIFAGSPDRVSLLCPTFYLNSYEAENLGNMAYIKKFRNVANPGGSAVYIAIYFSNTHLQDILHQNLTTTNSVYYIINSRNCIVASSNPGLAGTYYMNYDSIPEAIGSTQDFTVGKILGEELYMGYREIADTDWRLVSVIPVNNVFTEGQQLLTNTMYAYVLFVIMACVMALALSDNMARRLSRVVETMNKHRGQTPVKLSDTFDHDEIGQLVYNYNTMVDRINELIDEQAETAEKLKVSEVKALQAQINPHFLYNMLDMINWLSQSGKQKEVSMAVQTLSKFYKLTLSKKNITIPIGEELSHVELYVKLQNMRYENNIDFIIDIPDEILDYEIPKLVLQPIVENSIQHGIFEKESKAGNIVIVAWMEEGDILFVVSDDGVGIPSAKMTSILDGTDNSGTGSNIGIYNTHLRLQLLYGSKYGLHFESIYGHGTDVQVRIPAILFIEKDIV